MLKTYMWMLTLMNNCFNLYKLGNRTLTWGDVRKKNIEEKQKQQK